MDAIQEAQAIHESITQVVVSVHEKRNHPREYGHYDCEVRFTADVQPGQDADETATALRVKAHDHVQRQCDQWIESIEAERQRAIAAYNATISRRGGSDATAIDEPDDLAF